MDRAEYDLLIVGTGSAGVAAAIRASELGARTAIVERAEVIGGTCVNVGCIPSKKLVEAAHHYHAARTGFPGIAACEPQLVWEQVLRQKRELVESLRQQRYTDVLQAYGGITLLRGHAELLAGAPGDPVIVRVGDRDIRCRKIVLATGTRSALPSIAGLSTAGALDSTTVMEVERLPESLLVLGGGSIGLELGQAFRRFGVRVTVVEARENILPAENPDIAVELRKALEAEGVEIHTGTRVTRVERSDAGIRVATQQGSIAGSLKARHSSSTPAACRTRSDWGSRQRESPLVKADTSLWMHPCERRTRKCSLPVM